MFRCKDTGSMECFEPTAPAVESEGVQDLAEITRGKVLEMATQTVCHDRQDQHGQPENNFQTIADLWTTYLRASGVIEKHADSAIMPHDVAAMMCMLKIARVATGVAKLDNWVDLAGYAAIGGELEGV